MNRRQFVLISLILMAGMAAVLYPWAGSAALESTPPADESTQSVEEAILRAVGERQGEAETTQISLKIDELRLSQDQTWATAWILYYDQEIGIYLPTEPGVSVAHWDGVAWRVALPQDAAWATAIQDVPAELLSEAQKEQWRAYSLPAGPAGSPQTGYLLPFRGGFTGYVSRTVDHDKDMTRAHYSYDFYFPGATICPPAEGAGVTGSNFDIIASKAGTVWNFKDTLADCDHSEPNFLVLRNIDIPSTYQLYLHLSQGSIPEGLKHIGTVVSAGQFLGKADNTGLSFGSHLHFQVETQPNWPSADPYWGTSVDAAFDEVNIYQGHPRREFEKDPEYCQGADDDYLCNEFGRLTYVSANYPLGDGVLPTGDIQGITTGAVVTQQMLSLNGWASDVGSGLDFGQLKAFYAGSWHNLGAPFNPTFAYTWDLCAVGGAIPNGAVSVALEVHDIAGNINPTAGLHHFTKDITCQLPPPSCIPSANQVTLFEGAGYSGGCTVFGVGNYPNGATLGSVGDNDAESILVGSNVLTTLYSEANYSGHSRGVTSSDSTLIYDLLYQNSLSSMRVSSRSELPLAPNLVSPAGGASFWLGSLVPLAWTNGGGGLEYQVEVTDGNGTMITLPWQVEPFVYIGALPLGNTSWRVQARNGAGTGAWSGSQGFTVTAAPTPPPTVSAPYNDDMEATDTDWQMTGLWSFTSDAARAHSGTKSWWYQDGDQNYDSGAPNSGGFTSRPITIPIGNTYYLRFWYRYETETHGAFWDQRRVQISANGGAFTNFYALHDDPTIPEYSGWLQSPALSLADYSGDTIRIRFQFSTWDAVMNGFDGWGIDDVTIDTIAPGTCSDNRQDDTPAQATLLVYDPVNTTSGEICPAGDFDYYKFNGLAGQRIAVDINAQSIGSPLDSYLFLLGSDGEAVLAQSDDEVYGVRIDPLLGYSLPHDGVYYLKLRAWRHPGAGGNTYDYTIRLYVDEQVPGLALSYPNHANFIPDTTIQLTGTLNESPSLINRVEFYWHSLDWQSGAWTLLRADYDGSDGWTASFSPAGLDEAVGYAFYAYAYDNAGNASQTGAWNVGIDHANPVSQMTAPDTTPGSNTFRLNWTGSDNLSGIDYYELQENVNGGAWVDYPDIDGSENSLWVVGTAGNSYAYQIRGVDYSLNSEPYPPAAEVTVSIPPVSTLCSAPDQYDTGGLDDNAPPNASLVEVGGAAQVHNFCNPLAGNFEYDEDWALLSVQNGMRYLMQSRPTYAGTAVRLRLYAQDGSTLLAEATPAETGGISLISWTSDRDGQVYLRMTHINGQVIGNDVAYQFAVNTARVIFLPVIAK